MDWTRVDQIGDRLFGRSIRLRVLLWSLAQPGAFNQSQAARGIEYNSSGEVGKCLDRLVDLGMLRKFGRPNRVGPQNYVKVDVPEWEIGQAVARSLGDTVLESLRRERDEHTFDHNAAL